jgi:mediator of RNA polymerase II transcription subunit 5
MSLSKWKIFIRRCLLQRIQGEEFQELAELMIEQYRIPTSAIIKLLLSSRTSFCPTKDPLIPAYVHALVASGVFSISDVLLGLVSLWNQAEYREREETQPGACSEPDIPIVRQLASLAASADHLEEVDATKKSIVLASRWLGAVVQWVSRRDLEDISPAIMTLVDAIGSLLAAIASGTPGMEVLQDRINVQPREALKDTLQRSIPTFMSTSMQLANQLDLIQKHFGLFDGAPTVNPDESSGTKPHVDIMTFEASILDHSIGYARASLLLYLNATVGEATSM